MLEQVALAKCYLLINATQSEAFELDAHVISILGMSSVAVVYAKHVNRLQLSSAFSCHDRTFFVDCDLPFLHF